MHSTNSSNIKIEVVKNKEEGGKVAYRLIKEAMEEGAEVFGLATGSTPEMLYKELRESDLDFSDKIAVNLDEYIGLEADHPQSYEHFMKEQLFNDKPFKETHIPDGLATEEDENERYDEILEKNPIDVQILGIGTNAHIGFNEPGTPFDTKTHKIKLTEDTIQANKRYFESEDEVPDYAYSMGIASIMAAKKIILMAYGKNKAEAIEKTVNGPVSEDVPASILQKHPDVVIIVDEEAASQL
ncbi:glucosamine-6-phosphate deaminase [Alkalibacterium putridalgicola]|uniref:Glucosamine-6-phosphate deaminase n=1 Tax=Alkalibacterium putridalgicola TaxID=426703 RepID=A0A1H7U6Z1_9LACT|nr:glucosamine-6-phosphate deaminase [Alkalibacterium putridalgicola]SEL92820.1 glucosamine-6-phosphate deaminase [Alkalibacterium putridalgicola]